MLRALSAHHQERQIVSIQPLVDVTMKITQLYFKKLCVIDGKIQ